MNPIDPVTAGGDPGTERPGLFLSPILLLVVVAYGLAALGWGGTLFLAAAGSAAALLLPGNALLLAFSYPRTRARDLVLGAALSPVVLGATVAAALLTGSPVLVWVRGLLLGCGLGMLVLRVAGDGTAAGDDEEIPAAAWLVGLLALAAVALILLPEPWRRSNSDAWFHTAVVFEMARAGVPPQDPYFAGLTLQYFWFYHAVVLGLGAAAGLSPPDAMTLLNLAAALLTPPAASRVARALGFSPAAGTWAGVLVLLGMGGLSWLFFPLKLVGVLIGDVRGYQALHDIISLGATNPSNTSRLVQFLSSSSFMMRKYVIGTAVPWSLLLVLVAADAALRFVRDLRPADAALLVAAGAGAFLFHVVLGGALIAGLAAGAGILFLAGRGMRGRALGVAVLAAAALALCLPYLLTLVGGRGGASALPFGLSLRLWVSIPFTLAGVALLSVPAWRRLARAGTPAARLYMAWFAAVTLYALIARLPGANQYDKPPILIYLPLSLAAGMAVPGIWRALAGRPRTRVAFALLLVLFLLPENAFRWWGFYGEAAPPALTAAEHDLYSWVRDDTPRDAVFVDSADRMEVVVRGPRRQYWGIPAYAEQWGYDPAEMALRQAVRDSVYASGRIGPAGKADLASLHAPVYVIVRDEDTPGAADRLLALPRRYRPLFHEDGIRVFRIVLPDTTVKQPARTG